MQLPKQNILTANLNLCRCTGYHNIVKAVAHGAAAMGK